MSDREQLLDELRPVAFAIAYRMLGSVAEAEDVAQEALLRLHDADDVRNEEAFVTTVSTRLALDEEWDQGAPDGAGGSCDEHVHVPSTGDPARL